MRTATEPTRTPVLEPSDDTSTQTIDVLVDLLDALKVPGAIHPGLAASVARSAQELLERR